MTKFKIPTKLLRDYTANESIANNLEQSGTTKSATLRTFHCFRSLPKVRATMLYAEPGGGGSVSTAPGRSSLTNSMAATASRPSGITWTGSGTRIDGRNSKSGST